jgi:hypothetical protein
MGVFALPALAGLILNFWPFEAFTLYKSSTLALGNNWLLGAI